MKLIETHPVYFTQVRVPTDMDRAKREGKMGIITVSASISSYSWCVPKNRIITMSCLAAARA
jgi:hypothetical protein